MRQQPTDRSQARFELLAFFPTGASSVNELPWKIQLSLGLRQVPFLNYLKYRSTVPRRVAKTQLRTRVSRKLAGLVPGSVQLFTRDLEGSNPQLWPSDGPLES